jgi:YidC/Oxa1 family membrane protein insertase
MQSLGPKLEELKKKYKDNPAKMNQEMASIYKREGINPMSGCLPMLLQIPIFLALYGLFNNHFDLRGAAFFGWINDLSAPDSIWNFAPATVPFLGWNDVRLLPILFVATQLISSKMMQTPATVSNTQMKMMTYGIPVVFFFVLYDVPSGLLVYWIVQNVLSVVQQFVINKKRRRTQE